ncbi:cytidylyltransferase domain-containing protein [Stappia sp.]|uniref:cytidylyltransferase domain-containing protein n=1 Tax=Stappia sp. TaxID=1870903 RepID=UPI0032D8FBF3
MSGRIGLIVQARMGSVRLPGKSLRPLAGEALVGRVLERVKRAKRPDLVVLAIPDLPQDAPLHELGVRHGVPVFRGPDEDLVERYLLAAHAFGIDTIVRVPGDNPCPEPWVIDMTIDYHLLSENHFTSSYPDFLDNGFVDGIGCEVLDIHVLKQVRDLTVDARNREHPHTFLYENPDRFHVMSPPCPLEIRRPDIVLDVNTEPQFALMARLYESLYCKNPMFDVHDVIRWWDLTHAEEAESGAAVTSVVSTGIAPRRA